MKLSVVVSQKQKQFWKWITELYLTTVAEFVGDKVSMCTANNTNITQTF